MADSITLPTLAPVKHFYLCAALLVLAIVGGFYIHAKIEADAITKQTIAVAKQNTTQVESTGDAQIKAAQASMAQTQANLATQLAALAALKAQPIKPADYDRTNAMIVDATGATPATVKTTTDTTTNEPVTTLPTATLRDYTLSCTACSDNLAAAKQDNDDLTAQNTALTNEKTALTAEVKTDETLLKGGTFKHRLGQGLKQSLCGAGGMGAGLLTSRGSVGSGTSAGVGAATFAACELLLNKK